MKTKISLLAALFLVAGFVAHGVAAVLSRTELAPCSNYCRLKFPAITEESLTSDRPVLKGAESADIIDFYGVCSEVPTSENQIASQRREQRSSKEFRE
jgi:hypothetical protein